MKSPTIAQMMWLIIVKIGLIVEDAGICRIVLTAL
jgi:hypothetical protein